MQPSQEPPPGAEAPEAADPFLVAHITEPKRCVPLVVQLVALTDDLLPALVAAAFGFGTMYGSVLVAMMHGPWRLASIIGLPLSTLFALIGAGALREAMRDGLKTRWFLVNGRPALARAVSCELDARSRAWRVTLEVETESGVRSSEATVYDRVPSRTGEPVPILYRLGEQLDLVVIRDLSADLKPDRRGGFRYQGQRTAIAILLFLVAPMLFVGVALLTELLADAWRTVHTWIR